MTGLSRTTGFVHVAIRNKSYVADGLSVQKIKNVIEFPRYDSYLFKNWADWITAERYLNEGSRTYSPKATYSELNLKFRPQSRTHSFELPTAILPRDVVHIHTANPAIQLVSHYLHASGIRFPIHPQFYGDDRIPSMNKILEYPLNVPIQCIPTASSRSVFVCDRQLPAHCLKLHCPIQISRFNRSLLSRDIFKSIASSREWDSAIKEEATFPSSLAFLPESIGVVIGQGAHAWGYLIREMTPRPVVPYSTTLLPLFSLYSQDLRAPHKEYQHKPLITQLIRNSRLNPREFVIDKVMRPIIEGWCFLARERGILAQAHGQNLLLEIDHDDQPRRIVFRDLSTYMDRQVRIKKGLSNQQFLSRSDDPDAIKNGIASYYSLTYDSFVGHHLFAYIATVANQEYGIGKSDLQQSCRAIFHAHFPDANQFFPPHVYYYSKRCHDGITQETENTHQRPEWR